MGNISDETYIGQEVYLDNFLIESNSMPSNINVYESLDKYTIIGYGLVE